MDVHVPNFPLRSSSTGSMVLDTDIARTESEMRDLHMIDVEAGLDDTYVDILKTRFFGLGQ